LSKLYEKLGICGRNFALTSREGMGKRTWAEISADVLRGSNGRWGIDAQNMQKSGKNDKN
jgi:hypothetical protein